jgi:hypothetical protein
MFVNAITATILLAFGLTAQASQTFSNKGTLSGFDSINKEHKGTVEQVSDVYLEGPSALKMTQTYDSKYTGRYHSEVVHNKGYKLGDTGFYGFSFRLAPDWQSSPAQSYNIAQFIADFSDTKCDDWMPSTMVWVVSNKLYTRVKQGTICKQHIKEFPNLATVTPGQWHKIIIQASWKSDDTGFFKMWYDGVKVVEEYNIPTMINDGRQFSYRVGLYANGWHDDNHKNKGTQQTREIWYDEIAMGSAFADVDPAQWKRSRIARAAIDSASMESVAVESE